MVPGSRRPPQVIDPMPALPPLQTSSIQCWPMLHLQLLQIGLDELERQLRLRAGRRRRLGRHLRHLLAENSTALLAFLSIAYRILPKICTPKCKSCSRFAFRQLNSVSFSPCWLAISCKSPHKNRRTIVLRSCVQVAWFWQRHL